MRLSGGLINDGKNPDRFHEHLADINVTSDTHESWGNDCIRRMVEGVVTQRGSLWQRYMGFWSGAVSLGVAQPVEVNERKYMFVTLLQVDYDVYSLNNSWLNLDGSTIRLILLEHFYGEPDGYRVMVEERNRKVRDYLAWINKGEFTKNDMREMRGLPSEPRFDQLLPAEEVLDFKKRLLLPTNDRLRNMIV